MGNIIKQAEYGSFLNEIKTRIRAAQYEALKAVNKELISLYWDIGKMIVERQDKQGWGKSVVQNLAADLQKEFQGTQGFSAAGLWRMRIFYQTYKESEKLAPLVREIGWSHNQILPNIRLNEKLQPMVGEIGWSRNIR
jgi:predicted nuclease of restriction endonuclease-like (RecB) superfamily